MSSKPTVALILPKWCYPLMFDDAVLQPLRQIAAVGGPFETVAEAAQAMPGALVAITGWGSPLFDQAALDRLASMKLLAHSAGTVRGIVSEAVFDRGIRVINAADANAIPVAHFTVMMMVAMLKQVPWLIEAMRRNDSAEMDRRRAPKLRELQNITVGLVGASRIGRLVVGLLKVYPGVKIKMYDPYLSDAAAADLGVEKVSLEEVCICEVVSIHAPNIPETQHMFNARTLALLPDHAVLINTSRGALVDEAALIAEVRRRPLYVSLDVTDPEPPAADSPLRREANILLTPHIAGAQKQAQKEMGKLTIAEAMRFINGEALKHEVTRAMMKNQA